MKNLVQEFANKLSFLASQIVAPQHVAGDTFTNIAGPQQGVATPVNLVEAGDPVVIGRIVGVAASDALLSTQKISVYIHGVYNLTVKSIHNGLSAGETVYIDPTTAVLSDDQTGVPYGCAQDVVPINSTGTLIRVVLFGLTPGAIGAGS